MAKLASHPATFPGAASYWAEGKDVYMRDNEGHTSCIQCCQTEGRALDAAKKWQVKENASVSKANLKAVQS